MAADEATPGDAAEKAEADQDALDLVLPTVYWFEYDGGTGKLQINAAEGVAWSATFQSSTGSWLVFTGSASGTGPGSLSFLVTPDADAPRSGTIDVTVGSAKVVVNVVQLAAPFWYEQLVLSMPLPVIEQMALLGFIKEINKAPPPARPPLFAALMAAIVAVGPMVEAIYLAHPTVPQTYTPLFISREVQEAVTYVLEHLSGQ